MLVVFVKANRHATPSRFVIRSLKELIIIGI
jgi:hypothetical protein